MENKFIDNIEIYNLPFGTKIKIIWSDEEFYIGVIVNDTIYYEDGINDKITVIAEHMSREMCKVQLF
ncbi:MAG: hypothetical protein K0R54_595 [Clostridiaceae bacterium]|jgi:hypothetical protein|nr:hypothetical protein [Clostridiaceae bacterium]